MFMLLLCRNCVSSAHLDMILSTFSCSMFRVEMGLVDGLLCGPRGCRRCGWWWRVGVCGWCKGGKCLSSCVGSFSLGLMVECWALWAGMEVDW